MSRKPPIPEPNRGPAPEPAAADELDAAVHQILQKLKEGKPVRLPGLGTLRPGPEKSVLFDELRVPGQKGAPHGGKKPGRG
ncbi:MAG: hypothetical protein ABSC08_07835 [Bryobacteraceae bacterium]|jgi:hypothetical protein